MAGVLIKREKLDIKTDMHRVKKHRNEDTEKAAIMQREAGKRLP